jgi:hypothetical protein
MPQRSSGRPAHGPLVGRRADEHSEEHGLARSVRANHGQAGPRRNEERKVLQNQRGAIAYRQVLDLERVQNGGVGSEPNCDR